MRYKLEPHILVREEEIFDSNNTVVHGITPNGYRILEALEGAHSMSVKELAEDLGLPEEDVAEFLEQAEKLEVLAVMDDETD